MNKKDEIPPLGLKMLSNCTHVKFVSTPRRSNCFVPKLNIYCFVKSTIFLPKSTLSEALTGIRIKKYFPSFFSVVNFSKNSILFTLINDKYLVELLKFFKYSCFFKCLSLTDLFAADLVTRAKRYELTYSLISV